MKPIGNANEDAKEFVVIRGRVDSVEIYEVKENELEILEKGSPANIQLNFAIFLFSTAFSAVAAVLTCDFKYRLGEMVFVFTGIIGVLLGAYLFISWWRTRESISKVVKKIRDRIPTPPTAPEAPEVSRGDAPASDAPVG